MVSNIALSVDTTQARRGVMSLKFNFNSEAPFSFNLHYHDEGEVFYEIKEDSVEEFDFIFKPEKPLILHQDFRVQVF